MTQLTDNIFCVEVPDDAQDFIIKPRYVKSEEAGVLIWFDYRGASAFHVLPHPYFDFLFTTKGATEEQAHEVVENVTTVNEISVYRDYQYTMWVKSAISSLNSLLCSKGCNTEKNLAILKLNDDGTE